MWKSVSNRFHDIALHARFPDRVWVVVEQPPDVVMRLQYYPEASEFRPTPYRSLLSERGFRGAYGWIGGFGLPPEFHVDVLLYSARRFSPGSVAEGIVCGVLFLNNGDHKVLTVDPLEAAEEHADLLTFPPSLRDAVTRGYPASSLRPK